MVFVLCRAGSGFCDKLITHAEDSYRVYVSVNVRVYIVCDVGTSTMGRPRRDLDSCVTKIN
jgi:hypothetical protein